MSEKFTYRGFMLDVSRHYMPVGEIRRFIKAASICGMNKMHWHLTDDQGWRIEIKKYPKLTGIGSVRGCSYFGDVSETENNNGFYTQDEIRELVGYAKTLGIEIIPEIEIPGHASAMLAAYPQYGCRRTVIHAGERQVIAEPYSYHVMTTGGIFPNLICAGKDEAVQFLEDILEEVTELFPASAIHIGGDEALKQHWRRCPDCQRRIREEGLVDENGLQRWLVLKMGEYLNRKGKQTIVWNDSLAGGMLPEHFIVQHWMGNDRETAEFMAAGGKVICSDVEHYYFDYPYSSVDAYHIWEMPDIPLYAQEHPKELWGVECPLWTERVTNTDRAAYLLFPRMTAVALKASDDSRERFLTWESFRKVLQRKQEQIEALGLRGAPESQWHMQPEDIEADRLADEYTKHSPGADEAIRVEHRLLLQEELEKLLTEIEMPKEYALQIMDYAWRELPEYAGITVDATGVGVSEICDQLLIALHNRKNGGWKDIPHDIWIATMKCFARFVGEYKSSYGSYGFDRGFWTVRQINARLFRIGELEYELRKDPDIIDLHIPSDARLQMSLLEDSVRQAKQFLAQWFPGWADAPMECESWLLAPALKGLLAETSHILQFQNAFEIMSTDPDAMDVLEWVFGLAEGQQKDVQLQELPEKTSLQKRMKQYLLEGGHVGVARGRLTTPARIDQME